MTHASLAQRFADDGFVLPISAIAADEIAHLPGRFELVAADAELDAKAVAVHSQASRMRQVAIHAANRTA
ncbi:MAG: hypothetical protein J4G15_13075 [Alphaproteobacteria bacterium]|nr:hypothetical protein [Alphaproteobacteria bacterium]